MRVCPFSFRVDDDQPSIWVAGDTDTSTRRPVDFFHVLERPLEAVVIERVGDLVYRVREPAIDPELEGPRREVARVRRMAHAHELDPGPIGEAYCGIPVRPLEDFPEGNIDDFPYLCDIHAAHDPVRDHPE